LTTGRFASLKLIENGSELDFSDLIVLIVHLASLKLMEIGFDGFVEIGGVQPSDIGWKFSSIYHYVNEM
jgi:hypothetical protein